MSDVNRWRRQFSNGFLFSYMNVRRPESEYPRSELILTLNFRPFLKITELLFLSVIFVVKKKKSENSHVPNES